MLKDATTKGRISASAGSKEQSRVQASRRKCRVHSRPPDNLQTLCILTDSLTSIHLLNRALYNPESLRFHKHKQLLFETAETLQSRPFPVHIMKVRAHTGVRGNEMADQLATQAHDPESEAVTGRFFAAGTSGRGPHWVQYLVPLPDDRGFERWNANDLQQHLLKLASAEQTKLVLTDPKTSIIKKIKSLLNEHGGLDVQASQAIWACTTLSPWEKRMAALIRSQRLWTTARMVKCRRRSSNEDQPTDATCPYCFHGIDDAYHALNDCGAGHAKPACTLRHDDAVCRVVTATLAGDNAERLLLWDATSATRTPGEATDRKLPAWILPHAVQHSIPDIFRISVPKGYEGPGPSLAAKQHGVITLVEIKYAPDPDLNGAVRKQAKDQHKDLRTSLLAQGWGTVNLYPVIIGNAGTITNTANDALQALGVGAAARITLLKRLAVDSLRRTAEIWKPRLGQRTSRGAPPRPVPSPMPPANPDAPGPIDPPVQRDDAAPNPAVEEHPDVADDHQPSTDSVPDTEHMPWQIITRSRARRTGADATAGPSQATQPLLHEQARPSKRSRNRFAALESDDVLRPQSADAQPSCGASHPSVTAQDEATQTSPCIHTARPQPSLTSEPNAQNGAAAPQSPLTPADDRAHIASQPRRSERIRANTLSQQIAATASRISSDRQPTVVAQDETHDAIPSIRDDCPQTAGLPTMDTDDGTTAVQRPLLRRQNFATSQLRRSTRLQTMSQHQQQQPMSIVSIATSQAAPSQLLTQFSHMAPKPSMKRKPTEAFHMTLRRSATRQCTEQPSLQHAHIMESADERPSNTSPHSSSGQPFDPG